jgi:hypothetical protein
MTKHEAAWLSLRVFGLVLAISAVQHIAAVVYFVWQLASGFFRDAQENVGSSIALQASLPHFIYGAAALAATYYLLFRGEALHRLIMREHRR